MSRRTIRIAAIALAILGALALGLGAMANTASAQSIHRRRQERGQGQGQGQRKGRARQEGPAALPGLAKKGKQLLDPKAKQLVGSNGQRPSHEGQDRQGQARHKGQARHQGQDRQRPAHERQGGQRQAREGQDRERQAGERQDRQGQAGEGQSRQRQDRKGQDREGPGREGQGSERARLVKDKGVAHQIQDRQGSSDQDRPRPVCASEIAGRAHKNPSRAPHRDRRRTGAAAGASATRSGRLHRRAARHRDTLRVDRDGVPRRAECLPRSQWRLRRRGTA